MAVRTGVVKAALAIMAVCLAGYIVVPPLYWHLKEGIAAVSRSSSKYCPPCDCDCDFQPLLSISQGLNNSSFSDCAKRDPEVNEDTQKNFAELLSEELKTREAETLENHRRADMALLEAKKMTSQYQKEADKCNSGMVTSAGMVTSEEAREKAESALLDQKQLTAMRELRARQKGWSESQSQLLRFWGFHQSNHQNGDNNPCVFFSSEYVIAMPNTGGEYYQVM